MNKGEDQSINLSRHQVYANRYMCGRTNNILPAFTEKCLKWLLTRPLKTLTVFEYGAEAATTWWRDNVKDYEGLCYGEGLGKIISAPNHEMEHLYLAHIDTVNKNFDVVVINGRWRDQCVARALPRINKGGYLIINNYHQHSANFPPRYWKQADKFLERYPEVIFHDENHDGRTGVWQIV